jgi:hypothetical protein
MEAMSEDSRKNPVTREKRQQVVEQRALAYFMFSGTMPGVCVYCGNMFAHERYARRHMATSKKCIAQRETGEAFVSG